MLQVAAANMEPDEFLVNLLAKYQLIEWSGDDFDCSEDDSIRQVTTLVEEYLNVVILVLGERHTPGVGEVTQLESIRKEVVQLLCVENMSNSKLTNSISFDIASRENRYLRTALNSGIYCLYLRYLLPLIQVFTAFNLGIYCP